jgi:hypothetical protein
MWRKRQRVRGLSLSVFAIADSDAEHWPLALHCWRRCERVRRFAEPSADLIQGTLPSVAYTKATLGGTGFMILFIRWAAPVAYDWLE